MVLTVMPERTQSTAATQNGFLWGARARDWADIQEGQVRRIYETVLERCAVGPGTVYLDAGCGAGMALQLAAQRGALVAGIDAAEGMLAVARRRVPHGEFHQGDLEDLPFPTARFDLVTGFNSFQFAANPSVALAQAKRVAKPGAPVVVMTWGSPDDMEAVTVLRALRPLLAAGPAHPPGPLSLSDEAELRAMAQDAGLEPAEALEVDCPWIYPDLATALRGLASAGGSARAMQLTSEEAVHQAHRQALRPFLQPDGSYRIGARFRCLFTRA